MAMAVIPWVSKAMPNAASFTIDTDHPISHFRPDQAFGLAFDGGDTDESAPLFVPANRAAIVSAGAARGSYRLRTELGIEAWHWSAFGQWSDPVRQEGYWTGDASRDDPARVSYGYRLPRRGDTSDEADNTGYSRLDDGDPATFWKSNPYLDPFLDGHAGEHTEWIKIDLGQATPVDMLELDWAAPFARRYRIQFWTTDNPYYGAWRDFPAGVIGQGEGGHVHLRLADAALPVRYVRLLLTQSSHTAPEESGDPRDRMGYALGEIRIGRIGPDGALIDAVRHGLDRHSQTLIYVSSTDPWHRAQDIDRQTEQPSPLAILHAGLVPSQAMMMPVGAVYDTPENAAAEIAYFKRRGLRVDQVELGEEPDGQRIDPEDYARLYGLFARTLGARWPDLTFGGPSLVNGAADMWLDASPDQSWTGRFLKALKAAGGIGALGFFSFEYYPFDNLCGPDDARIADQPAQLAKVLERLQRDGVPPGIPRVISELGLSAFTGRAEVEHSSAVFTADATADFLSHGGGGVFFYGSTPNQTTAGAACAGRGNLMLWQAKDDKARWPMPSYYGFRLLARDWAEPGSGEHTLFEARTAHAAPANIGAYPVRRPDGRWAVLLVNRETQPARITMKFTGTGKAPMGAADILRYDGENYVWSAEADHPLRDLPPRSTKALHWPASLTLSPLSLTLIREAAR